MKKDIHPDYHFITVQMTDGTTYQTRTTALKEGATMKLEIDPIVHPAWQEDGRTQVLEKGQLNKFQSKYGAISAMSALGSGKKKADETEDKKSA